VAVGVDMGMELGMEMEMGTIDGVWVAESGMSGN